MKLRLYSTIETNDAFEIDEELGVVILEDGELELIVYDDQLSDELYEFFTEDREGYGGDPSGMLDVTVSHRLEPRTEEHFRSSIPLLLEEFNIIGKLED